MAHALAELRCGIVAHQHEKGFKSGRNFNHTLYLHQSVIRYQNAEWNRNLGTHFIESSSVGHTLRNLIPHQKGIDYTATLQWLPNAIFGLLRPLRAFLAATLQHHTVTAKTPSLDHTYRSPQSGSEEHCMLCSAQSMDAVASLELIASCTYLLTSCYLT